MEEQDNREYIARHAHPIFEALLLAVLAEKPKDIVLFMMQWLNNEGQKYRVKQSNMDVPSSRPHQDDSKLGESKVNESRVENSKLGDSKYADIKSGNQGDLMYVQMSQIEQNQNEYQSYHSDNLQIQFQDQPMRSEIKQVPQPQNESQEFPQDSFFKGKNYDGFQHKIVQKSQEQIQRVMRIVNETAIFRKLDQQGKDIIVQALEEKKVRAKELVITQGEDGKCMYIVEQGQLECTKKEATKFIKHYQPGDYFGELALLNDKKRVANVQAKTECLLWCLDKETFVGVAKDEIQKKRKLYEKTLRTFQLIQNIDPYERALIADAIQVENFKSGDYVIKQKEKGDYFYLILSGELVALKDKSDGSQEEVLKYSALDYFGELALMKDQPRQTTIECITDCTLYRLDRQIFRNINKLLSDVLKKNTQRYLNYKY